MVSLGQQGGPLGKWGLRFKNVIHISDLDKALSQGKVAEILDRIKF
jgi:hypothetical protein